LVIVLTILGIISAIAAPRFAAADGNYRVNAAARRLVADLTTARATARHTSAPRTVTFTPAAHTYIMAGVRDAANRSADSTIDLSAAPYRVTMTSAAFGGATAVTFDFHGLPDRAGTIVVSAGGYARTVSINADTGEATTE